MSSKDIALSAISAAIVGIALTVGAYVEIIDICMLAIATIAVMLPLYKNLYWGSICAFFAGGLIGFFAGGMNIQRFIYPAYFFFAGLYPVINALFVKWKLNKWLAHVIKLVWCFGAVYLIYWLSAVVWGLHFDYYWNFVKENIWYILIAVSFVLYVLFDLCINQMQRFLSIYLTRIIK